MTFQVFAMYPEGSYLVAESNDAAHADSHGDRVLKALGIVPHAVARIIKNEHTIKGDKFTIAQLIAAKGGK